MKRRRVVFTAVAHNQLHALSAWWFENQRPLPLLVDEVEAAMSMLSVLPGVGSPYPNETIVGLRRLFLRRCACHVYYAFTAEVVTVVAFWHAKRGSGPLLDA